MGTYGDLGNLSGKVAVVTGAAGYLGRELTAGLLSVGVAEVRALDIDTHQVLSSERVRAFSLDISAGSEALLTVVKGADLVIHTASYGMSGPSMLNKTRIYSVNVDGTKALLDACRRGSVKALVYTSTYNVVFGGQEIVNGTEASCAYFPIDHQVDEYSKSKTIAEQLVLTKGEAGHPLRCCAIRPNAIYGEEEERHLPRIVDLTRRGLARFTIGTPEVRTDWVHARNVVSAHLLAADNLLGNKQPCAAGEAFFISDGHPVNQFQFLALLMEAVGGKPALLQLPVRFMYAVAFVLELLFRFPLTRPIFTYVPLLTRAEVNKSGVTHYCSTVKAERILGYRPIVQHPAGIASVAAVWRKKFE